jgi:hypothetical protein
MDDDLWAMIGLWATAHGGHSAPKLWIARYRAWRSEHDMVDAKSRWRFRIQAAMQNGIIYATSSP